ncbi:hypothetical protein SBRCBS47491_000892 [Sporothrix bragantina]|uniref:Zn(2)-C6 fungal-type domain-containing protein n=1 Tax=Sporothrix bragantina TaxID=671064 RepID=A0ABP0AU32_9PEZI
MVNRGGRSRGCLTCRRRRVKCDERQPHCQRCQKAGILCSGYTQHGQFVDETVRFRVSKTSKSTKRTTPSPSPSPSRDEMQLTRVSTRIPLSLQPDEDFVIHKHLVARLLPRVSGPTAPDILSAMVNYESPRPFSDSTPAPIHKDAIRALAAVYFGKVHRDTRIFDMGVRAYVRSLHRLRTALASPVAVLEVETLVSVLCMGLYENVALSDTAGWLNHYEGISYLVRIREGT